MRRVALVATLALVLVPAAYADADPASDILYLQRIYLPFFGEKVSDANAQTLKKVVDKAWAKGYKVKVALIASRNDLGGVFQLWERPQTYADFLGRELIFLYKGKVLTAMPNGIGVYQYKTSVDPEKAIVRKIDIGEGADGIANAATVAVARLAGLKVPPLPSADGGGDGGTPVWELVVIIVGGLALLAAMVFFGPRVWRRRTP